METILETIGDYGAAIKDTDLLTEYVRSACAATITRQYVSGNTLKVITVDLGGRAGHPANIRRATAAPIWRWSRSGLRGL
jgi:type III secretory pathway component EscV